MRLHPCFVLIAVLAVGLRVIGGEPDEQPDSPAPEDKKTKPMVSCRELYPILEQVVPAPQAGKKEIIVLHLNGPFEPANIFAVGRSISFGVFEVLMDFASARKPAAIVLKIDSGGGRVDQMDAIIEKLLAVQGGQNPQRVVAWVNLGGSAAALTALACREIVMMPQGRLGAATRIYANGEAVEEPESALDNKLEAMRDARRRQIASITGRHIGIQEAMEKPEQRLWHHPLLGFSLEEREEEGWNAYDTDKKKPLALDAQALQDVGVAKGLAEDAAALLFVLGLPARTPVTAIDLADPAIQDRLTPARELAAAGNKQFDAYRKRVKKEADDIELAIRSASGILTAEDGYLQQDILTFLAAIKKCQSPSLDPKTQKFLQETAPWRLAEYEEKLASVKRLLERAHRATVAASRANGIAIGAVLEDLRLAKTYLVEILVYQD